jgi:hypothetical protein
LKPAGYFTKGTDLITIMAKKGESDADAIARVASKHGVDVSAITQTPPKGPDNPGHFSSVEVEGLDDPEPPPPSPPPPETFSPGDGVIRASKGLDDFYRSPPQSDKKQKAVPSGEDQSYTGLLKQ